jgi:hypothetical protein
MKIIAFRVGQKSRVEELPDDLDAMQAFVGGLVEALALGGGLTLWCNEEGKLKELPYNRTVLSFPGGVIFSSQSRVPTAGSSLSIVDHICGDFFLARDEGDHSTSVTDEDIFNYTEES